MKCFVNEIVQSRNVLYIRIYADIKSTIAGTKLGAIWWLLDPLFIMAIYYFIFKLVWGRGGPDYHIFILTGIIPWQWFARSLGLGATAFTRNRSMILTASQPFSFYILAPILVHLFFTLFGFLIVFIFVRQFHFIAILNLAILLITQAVMSFALCSYVAIVNVFIPDLSKMIAYVIRFVFYLSPILYGLERVMDSKTFPDEVKRLYLLNPFSHLMPAYREVTMGSGVIDYHAIGILLLISIVLMCGSIRLVDKMHNVIVQKL